MLAIRLMRMGAKKAPSYRVVVKEKLSKRDGSYIEKVGFYDPTRQPAEVRLDMERVRYWMERGAQPTDTVRNLIRQQARAQSQQAEAATA
jgi:small subunit ribosomal protein S16